MGYFYNNPPEAYSRGRYLEEKRRKLVEKLLMASRENNLTNMSD